MKFEGLSKTALLLLTFSYAVLFPLRSEAATDVINLNVTPGTVWTADGNPYILYNLYIPSGSDLTIEPGVIIKFPFQTSYITVDGTLNINGTADNPVFLTSYKDDSVGGDTNGDGNLSSPNPDDFSGIFFRNGSVGNLNHFYLRYGGGRALPFISDYGMLRNIGGTINIDGGNFQYSSFDAIKQWSGSTYLTNSSVTDNFAGIYVDSGNSSATNSYFRNNHYYAYNNFGSDADARNSWWGDPSGPKDVTGNPSGLGDIVSIRVNYTPWLTQDPHASTTPSGITKPVIIIPGILGSMFKDGKWVIDPIFHVYDNLIETLEANGYEDGKTLFTLPYDWRNSNIDTTELLDQKIDEMKVVCGCTKVDIVAHSMGGLVARAYAQSENYDGDIDNMIFLGTPHKGAPKDYLAWEAGEFPKDIDSNLIKLILKNQAKKFGYQTLYDYVKNWPIVSVKQLLPTYDYLKLAFNDEQLTYPNGYPENIFLSDLNQGLVSLLQSDINIKNFVGDTGANTISTIRLVPSSNLPLWEHGYPEGFDSSFSNQGLEMGFGDGTVPLESAKIGDQYDIEISSKHTSLPTDAEAEIYKILTNNNATQTVNESIPSRILFTTIFSPADIVVIAPDGKKVGKNFVTGEEINEISGAFYSGFNTEDEFVAIPDPMDGEYKIETKGTGNGGEYTLEVTNISDGNFSDSNFVGQTIPDLETAVSFNVSGVEDITIIPEDKNPPTIDIISPAEGGYEHSRTINISADFTDNTGIATSSVMLGGKYIENSASVDLFFEKLGTSTIMFYAKDFQGNYATSTRLIKVIATASSTISDIQRTYSLGWIYKVKTRDELIKMVQKVVRLEGKVYEIFEKIDGKNVKKRIEKIEKIIDKTIVRAILAELKMYRKERINERAYNVIKDDLEWLLNN